MYSSFAISGVDVLPIIDSTLTLNSVSASNTTYSFFVGDDTSCWFDGAKIKESLDSGCINVPRQLQSAEDIEEWLMSL